MGRPHTLLNDPQRLEAFAAMVGDAVTRAKMAEEFGVAESTITEWKKLEAVQKAVTRYMRQRSNSVRAHTDTRIIKMLESGKELSVKQLLEIRSEFSDGLTDGEGGDSELIAKLMEAAAKSPVLAREMQRVLGDAA